MKRTALWALAGLVGLLLDAGCGGPRTRVIDGHSVEYEGEYDDARVSIDGTAIRVVYDRVSGAYRAPGCDFGPAATLESLIEQIVATSPETCEPLEAR